MTDTAPVVIVGAGLAGLACAVELQAAGVPVRVLEASDGVGGRVRTDRVDGFLLDRGFQVLLTAYPELHRMFDVEALDLQPFDPGSLVWRNGRGHVVADPFRRARDRSMRQHLADIASTALAPIGSPLDKARIAWFRRSIQSGHPAALLHADDGSTADRLAATGFSAAMISRFFTPLGGGIQLDPDLQDSRRMFDIVFRMLADGDSAVPADGMGAIPEQLASRLPTGVIELDRRVDRVEPDAVTAGDERIEAAAVVVATEGPAAAALVPDLGPVASKQVSCVYFAADEPPTDRRLIVLDGTGVGPVLNVAVMSNVAPKYAPPGKHLIAAAAPGRLATGDVDAVRAQLRGWWGGQVDRWEHVATYEIAHGQPAQHPPFSARQSVRVGGLFVCGDHRDTASIQGALFSGRRTAAAVLDSKNLKETA